MENNSVQHFAQLVKHKFENYSILPAASCSSAASCFSASCISIVLAHQRFCFNVSMFCPIDTSFLSLSAFSYRDFPTFFQAFFPEFSFEKLFIRISFTSKFCIRSIHFVYCFHTYLLLNSPTLQYSHVAVNLLPQAWFYTLLSAS